MTTYQALFTPKSTFSGEKAPRAIIFDDAHVAEKLIRDSFTLRIDRAGHPELYSEIVDAVRPEFESIKRTEHLDFVVDSEGPGSIALCPPASAFNHAAEIITALKKAAYGKHNELKFATIQLFEHIKFCAIMISSRYLEIAPPFIPAFHFDFLGEGTRRIYLSATLDNETDFARAFGRRAVNRIEPPNDAGNGERLILLDSLIKARPKKVALTKALIKKHKLLIAVPSGRVAREWSDIGRAPERSGFSSKLQAFRENKSGSFILVSRVDGIDLPHDTCRVMIIDGSPMGSSLLERYQYDLIMGNLLSSKMASRITQLFGRINRARSDFGCFLIYNSDLNVWLKTDRNIALLPPLLRKQLVLGRTIQEGESGEGEGAVLSLIDSVLDRNKSWMEYYRDSIDNLELDESLREEVRKRELQMSIAAVAECNFMSSLWVGDTIAARRHLTEVLEEVSQYDAKLAGWYSLWLGMTYEADKDPEAAFDEYARSRSNLPPSLCIPKRLPLSGDTLQEPKSSLGAALFRANLNRPDGLGLLSRNLKKCLDRFLEPNIGANSKEEALRQFGALIGYNASRPDNDESTGPDVLWVDVNERSVIAFELKTEKKSEALYSKKEIGQAFNSIQWVADNHKNLKCEGLLFIGPEGKLRAEANPASNMFLVTPSEIEVPLRLIISKIDDAKGKTDLDRWAIISKLSTDADLSLGGLFRKWGVLTLKRFDSEL